MTRVLCFLSLLLVALTVQAETLTGRVVGVHDGDTLTLRVAGNRQVKVRLAGIDAPERVQPFGQKSKQSLSELAFDQPATVVVSKIDDYGRSIGVVTVAPVKSEFAGRCGAKRTCGEMASCEEARFYLTQCGLSRLDGDKDGTPCEALCVGEVGKMRAVERQPLAARAFGASARWAC